MEPPVGNNDDRFLFVAWEDEKYGCAKAKLVIREKMLYLRRVSGRSFGYAEYESVSAVDAVLEKIHKTLDNQFVAIRMPSVPSYEFDGKHGDFIKFQAHINEAIKAREKERMRYFFWLMPSYLVFLNLDS